MSITLKRINNHIVKPIPVKGGNKKEKPVKGAELFDLYCNIFLCSRKKSGKTSLTYKIIEETCTKNTTIIAFVGTINKDKNWLSILDYCDRKGINVVIHTTIADEEINSIDKLEVLVRHLKEAQDEPKVDVAPRGLACETAYPINNNMFDSGYAPRGLECGASYHNPRDTSVQEGPEPDKKPSRSKWRVPEYLFIFDDISKELKHSESLCSLLKESRHILAKVIVSSQSWTDVPKNARDSFDYFILFKGIPEEKLEEIYNENALNAIVTFDQFNDIYHSATDKKYQFLYIDKENQEFRQNLNIAIKVNDIED